MLVTGERRKLVSFFATVCYLAGGSSFSLIEVGKLDDVASLSR